jgi:hypothetical protein
MPDFPLPPSGQNLLRTMAFISRSGKQSVLRAAYGFHQRPPA